MLSADATPQSTTKPTITRSLADILNLDGDAFIEGCYSGILQRLPDATGGRFYLDQLRNGVAKNQIIHEIASSEEAECMGVMSFAGLLSLNGKQFIEWTYFALLKRLPDTSGGNYYLNQLLNGAAKIEILAEISSSEEGRHSSVTIKGMRRAITRFKRAKRPLRGLFMRLLGEVEGTTTTEVRLRSIEQQILLFGQRIDAGSSRREDAIDSFP